MNKLKDFWEFHKTLAPALRYTFYAALALIAFALLFLTIASQGVVLIVFIAIAALIGVVVTIFVVIDKYEDYQREQRYKKQTRNW